MDRFSEQTPADLARSSAVASRCNRDEDGYIEINDTELPGKCPYCDRIGGTPFLLIGGELHCSLCFEEFTDEELAQYLIDSGGPSTRQVGRFMMAKKVA